MKNGLVLIKGAGDIASGIACRLWCAGFAVVMTDLAKPTVIRRAVAFASAIISGACQVENINAQHSTLENYLEVINQKKIAVISNSWVETIEHVKPKVIVDAVLAKKNTGTYMEQAEIVIAVGPGFSAGHDVDAVVESKRGHGLGRVIYSGAAENNTGVPGVIAGVGEQRVLRSPIAGIFTGGKAIGDIVQQGEIVAKVGEVPIVANISGVVRGILVNGLFVDKNFKVGDIDPRGRRDYCFTVSDKARAIGGGVLEAIITYMNNTRC